MAIVGSSTGLGGGTRAIPKATNLFQPVPSSQGSFGGVKRPPKIKPPAGAKSVAIKPGKITNAPITVAGLSHPYQPATPVPYQPAVPGTSTTTEPSPYDSTYYIDLANATQHANDRIAGYQRNIDTGQINTNNAIQQLQAQQVLSTRNAQNVENARGGFAQGALGDTIGRIGKASLDAQSADTLRYQQDVGNWRAAMAGVAQGLSTEQIALGLASADRVQKSGLQGVTTTTDGTPAVGTPPPGPPEPVTAKTGTVVTGGRIHGPPGERLPTGGVTSPVRVSSGPTTNAGRGRGSSTAILTRPPAPRSGFGKFSAPPAPRNPTGLQTSGHGRVIPKKKGR